MERNINRCHVPVFQPRAGESLSGCAVFSTLSAGIVYLADILALVRTEILLESDQGCTDFRRCHDADEMSGENLALEHYRNSLAVHGIQIEGFDDSAPVIIVLSF